LKSAEVLVDHSFTCFNPIALFFTCFNPIALFLSALVFVQQCCHSDIRAYLISSCSQPTFALGVGQAVIIVWRS